MWFECQAARRPWSQRRSQRRIQRRSHKEDVRGAVASAAWRGGWGGGDGCGGLQVCSSWAGDRRELGRTYFPVQTVPIRPQRISFPALHSAQPFHFPLTPPHPPPPPLPFSFFLFLSLSLISSSPYPFFVEIAPFFLVFDSFPRNGPRQSLLAITQYQ